MKDNKDNKGLTSTGWYTLFLMIFAIAFLVVWNANPTLIYKICDMSIAMFG